MEAVFLKIVNMSIAASWLTLAVILLRFLLKKTPKWMNLCLWGIVGLRLVLPFSLTSIFSILPSRETLPEDILTSPMPQIHSGISVVNTLVNPVMGSALMPTPGVGVTPMQIIAAVGAWIWLSGLVLMLCYMAISFVRIRKRVSESVRLEGNVFESDGIESPFLLGVVRPRIYLPLGMKESDREYVLAHERAHMKGGDHIFKLLGFLLLAVYWFNPFLWVAYILFCRDIEMRCDERVLGGMGDEIKTEYSMALVNCSAPRGGLSACPLAFGEVGVKARVKSILSYKKPTLWIIIAAILICSVAAVCFLTDPPEPPRTEPVDVNTPTSFQMGTDCEGVTLHFVAAQPDDEPPGVILKWKNETGGPITIEPHVRAYRDGKRLTQYAKIQYVEIPHLLPDEEYTDAWAIIGFGQEVTEGDIKRIDYSWPSGNYRFERDFTDGNGLGHTAYVEFQILENRHPIVYNGYKFYDSIMFDVDGDGVAERCSFGMGPTSGLFTFTVTISENGEDEYFSIFNSPFYYLSFQVSEEGRLQVQGVTQGNEPKTHIFDVSLKDDMVVLTDVEGHEDALAGYWGEQGIHSKYKR